MNCSIKKKCLFFLLVVWSFAVIIAQLLSADWVRPYLFNADALYLPTIFKDMIGQSGSMRDWFLTPAPYFFPDYLIYGLSYWVAPTIYSQIIVYSVLQLSLTLLVFWVFVREFFKVDAFPVALFLFLMIVWLGLSGSLPYVYYFLSAFHLGQCLVSVSLLACCIRFCRNEINTKQYGLIVLVSSFSYLIALSDLVFILNFYIPFCVTCFLLWISRHCASRRLIILAVVIGVSSILGALSYHWVVYNPTRYPAHLGFGHIQVNLHALSVVFEYVIQSGLVQRFIFSLYAAFVVYSFYRWFSVRSRLEPLYVLTIFSFFSVCAMIAFLLLLENLPVRIRYFTFAFSLFVILSILLLIQETRFHAEKISLAICLVVLLLLSGKTIESVQKNGIRFNFYPSDVACIDGVVRKAGLSHGISEYWDAKPIQAFSRAGITLAQYCGKLQELRWITSKRFFQDRYDFAIISNSGSLPCSIMSGFMPYEYTRPKIENYLYEINGEPIRISKCGNKDVYIYGKNNMRVH